jgi:GTP-sensing pleiotropic transcriptional regulator CodY
MNKTKESLNSDGQQFLQYQQNKREFKQWWSTIPPISTKQKKVETVMVDNSTNMNQNKRKFKQWWSTIFSVLLILVELLTITV